MKYYEIFFLLGITLILLSCNNIIDTEEKPDLGIPLYEIEIDEDEYAQLNANIFTNYSAIARLKVDNLKYEITIEHQGWTSRERLKKSYEINFRSGGKDPYINRSEIILSSQASDPGMLRTLLASDAFVMTGLKTFQVMPVFVYINDQPHGLYLLTEPINEEFFTARNFYPGELYKAVNTKAQFTMLDGFYPADGFEKRIPDDDNYSSLEEVIKLLDTEPSSSLPEKLERIFNVDSYLKYSAANSLTGNWDGIIHNFYLFKDRDTKQFEFIPWDFDFTFYSYHSGVINHNSNKLFEKIISVPEYENRYNEILSELNDNYSVSYCLSKIDEFKNLINTAYNFDRWFSVNGFNLEHEAENLRRFFLARNNYQ